MNGRGFVAGIEQVVRDSAIRGTLEVLERPPGRHPPRQLLEQSAWYRSLAPADKAVLAPHQGEFLLNCVKDGTTRLDAPDTPMLHDHYNAHEA